MSFFINSGMVKATIKKLLPRSAKLLAKLAIRYFKDLSNGTLSRFAHSSEINPTFKTTLQVQQPILNSKVLRSKENKVHNIVQGASSIAAVELAPGQVFSFWKALGKPSKKNGYKEGINIIEGKVKEETGGGLCQLATIVYHTALKAGLTVEERYNHSVDLYTTEERYTPLGSDASVFYGYKDLRFVNNLSQPVRFQFNITNDELTCHLLSDSPIQPREIIFETVFEGSTHERVLTKQVTNGEEEVIATSNYIVLPPSETPLQQETMVKKSSIMTTPYLEKSSI